MTKEPDWINDAAMEITHWLKKYHAEASKLAVEPSMFMYVAHRIADIIEDHYEKGTKE